MYFLREKVISGTQLPQETSLDSQICGPVLSLTPLEQSRDPPPAPAKSMAMCGLSHPFICA